MSAVTIGAQIASECVLWHAEVHSSTDSEVDVQFVQIRQK